MIFSKKKIVLTFVSVLSPLLLSNSANAWIGYVDVDCQVEPGDPDQHYCNKTVPGALNFIGWDSNTIYMTCKNNKFYHAVDFETNNTCFSWGETGGSTVTSIHRNFTNWCFLQEWADITIKCSDQ